MRHENRVFDFHAKKPKLDTGTDTLTQQHHRKDADLNEIVRRFGVTGKNLPPAALDPRYYGDFTDATDLQTALDRTRAAQDNFESLPAELRDRFAHDPVRLFRFVMDPKNADEAVKLGLLHRRAVQVTEPAEPSTNETA